MAKSGPSAAARQLAEIRAEQIASAAAELRDVFFAYDSFSITDEGRHALSNNVEWIKSNPDMRLKIEGHCDERGTSASNLVLGEKRAKAVRNYLVELGAVPDHLSVVSYGKERPFCTEHTESCYSLNRRGHLVVRTGKRLGFQLRFCHCRLVKIIVYRLIAQCTGVSQRQCAPLV
jgi:peptidoglycan-associated lipoprotein